MANSTCDDGVNVDGCERADHLIWHDVIVVPSGSVVKLSNAKKGRVMFGETQII